MSGCEDTDDDDADAARRRGKNPPAGADQRRGGGENGAALVPRHQHVADVPLAARWAHLTGEVKAERLPCEVEDADRV